MITIDGEVYHTIPEAMDRLAPLGLLMSEREFRRRVRISGAYLEHRRQLLLTEPDIKAVLETLRPSSPQPRARRTRPCPSSSSAAAARNTGTSRVPSADSVVSRARALARKPTPKRTG
jgi:hypothetical protein